jgi:predicted Zn-dependent protease
MPDFVELTLVTEVNEAEIGLFKINPLQVGYLARSSGTATKMLIQGHFFIVKGSLQEVEDKLRGILSESN